MTDKRKKRRNERSDAATKPAGQAAPEKAAPTPDKPPELAHDDREIAARSINQYTALLLGATALVLAGTWLFTASLTKTEQTGHGSPAPMASGRSRTPPAPKLQPRPAEGLAQLRAEETKQLSSYAWIDRKRGVIQIPIDRAIDILAERGLPTRKMGPPADDPVSIPNDASLTPPQGGRP